MANENIYRIFPPSTFRRMHMPDRDSTIYLSPILPANKPHAGNSPIAKSSERSNLLKCDIREPRTQAFYVKLTGICKCQTDSLDPRLYNSGFRYSRNDSRSNCALIKLPVQLGTEEYSRSAT